MMLRPFWKRSVRLCLRGPVIMAPEDGVRNGECSDVYPPLLHRVFVDPAEDQFESIQTSMRLGYIYGNYIVLTAISL